MGSDRLRRRVAVDFPAPGSAHGVMLLLDEFVGTVYAGMTDGDSRRRGEERLQAAVVILAAGDLERLKAGISLGLTDWRDLLVAADLAEADWPARLDQELGTET